MIELNKSYEKKLITLRPLRKPQIALWLTMRFTAKDAEKIRKERKVRSIIIKCETPPFFFIKSIGSIESKDSRPDRPDRLKILTY